MHKSSLKRKRTGEKQIARRINKFIDCDLPDGVHFNSALQTACFTIVCKAVSWDINCIAPQAPQEHQDQYQPESQDSQESDEEDQHWDFKRKVNHLISTDGPPTSVK